MLVPFIESIILISISARALNAREVNYSDLVALDVSCPERDKCTGYRNNLNYLERSCECDFACNTYKDCCVDAVRRSTASRTPLPASIVCLHYGEKQNSGVYAIANCSSLWNGPELVRQKCLGAHDFSDPVAAAPVTSIAQGITYRNLYCAECNNANMQTLKTFQFKIACEGLEDLTQDQIVGDLQYNQRRNSWGVNRLNTQGSTVFVECQIFFDVPSYLDRSVRYCRSNLISRCARNWTRNQIRQYCEDYMAVVFDDTNAYRNPHCAICNHKSVGNITCRSDLFGRKRPMSFALLLDVNQSDGDQVGMTEVATPACPSGHKYDPFFKKCRLLVCALPGHVIVNNKCTRG